MVKKVLLGVGIFLVVSFFSIFIYGYAHTFSDGLNVKNLSDYSRFFFNKPGTAFSEIYEFAFNNENDGLAYGVISEEELNNANKPLSKEGDNVVIYGFSNENAILDSTQYNSEILKMLTGKTSLDMENWNYKYVPVLTTVSDVNADGLSVGLFINVPQGKPFSNSLKSVTLSCPTEKTFLVTADNKEILMSNFKITKELQKEDGFISYCLDPNCNTLGKECVITRIPNPF